MWRLTPPERLDGAGGGADVLRRRAAAAADSARAELDQAFWRIR